MQPKISAIMEHWNENESKEMESEEIISYILNEGSAHHI